jgi:hypothetical protein
MSLHARIFCIGQGTLYFEHMAGRYLSNLQDAHGNAHGRKHPLPDLMGPFDTSFLSQMDNAKLPTLILQTRLIKCALWLANGDLPRPQRYG